LSSEEDSLIEEIDDIDMADLPQSRTLTPDIDELSNTPAEGDFALLQFPIESGDSKAYYVGQLSKIKENQEIEVSCLRKSVKCANKFVFPVVPDSTVIGKDQIVCILKSKVVPGTKRQQSAVTFEVELNITKFNGRCKSNSPNHKYN